MTRFVFPKIYDTIHVNITEIVKCLRMKQVSGTNFLSSNLFFHISRLKWGVFMTITTPQKNDLIFRY